MRRVAAVIVAVVCGVAGGCGADDGADTGRNATGSGADASPAAELRGTLERSRLFAARRALYLELRDTGDRDVQVGSIQLSSPLFEPVEPERRDVLVRAGAPPRAMPLPYGAVRCDAEPEGQAELITDVDGEEVRIPLDENPSGILAEIHADECVVAEVLADVELRFGDRWQRTGPRAVAGELEVRQRRPGVRAVVEDVEGNVIFALRTGDEVARGLEVDDDRPSATTRVEIDASRCDPHALIEYKRTFILPAWVRVGDGDPVRVDVEVEGAARRALDELLALCLD